VLVAFAPWRLFAPWRQLVVALPSRLPEFPSSFWSCWPPPFAFSSSFMQTLFTVAKVRPKSLILSAHVFPGGILSLHLGTVTFPDPVTYTT